MPTERRRNLRLGLAIPLRVQGFEGDGTTWEEMTTTLDVSSGGACFPLGHGVDLGRVLLLSLPLPRRLRQFDLTDTSYRVYSIVRGVRRAAEPVRVGVMFFGKYPPRDFRERPAARFLLPTDSLPGVPVPQGLRAPEADDDPPSLDTLVGEPADARSPARAPLPDDRAAGDTPPALTAPSTIPRGRAAVPPPPVPGAAVPEFQHPGEGPADRRRAPRVQIFVNFTIQLVDEWGAVLQEELTVADNVSKGGARVMTSFDFDVGDVVLLQEAGGGFATRAEVRGTSQVQPTVDRLHLRFLDRQAPDRLLRQ